MQAVLGAQPGGMQMCFCESQLVPLGHAPQSTAWPQLSPMVPQYCPPAKLQLVGVQFGLPHRFATPDPPQVSGLVQLVPQSMGRPQPSLMVPQYVPPVGEQVNTVAVHPGSPQTLGMNAPQT